MKESWTGSFWRSASSATCIEGGGRRHVGVGVVWKGAFVALGVQPARDVWRVATAAGSRGAHKRSMHRGQSERVAVVSLQFWARPTQHAPAAWASARCRRPAGPHACAWRCPPASSWAAGGDPVGARQGEGVVQVAAWRTAHPCIHEQFNGAEAPRWQVGGTESLHSSGAAGRWALHKATHQRSLEVQAVTNLQRSIMRVPSHERKGARKGRTGPGGHQA